MRIFLTVGSMLPFDRLVRAMDAWAGEHGEARVFAQIGASRLQPVHLDFRAMLSPGEYRQQFAESDLVVSHVGMGTVITAAELGKSLVMLPRRPDLHEVTNNHQFATAQWLKGRPGVRIVLSADELAPAIAESIGGAGISQLETGTRGQLIGAIRQFISARL